MKILIVDDEDSIARALKRAFLSKGHQAETANCGNDAIDRLRDSQFDLLLVDLIMPDITGEEVITWAQENQIQAKFALMTAYQDEKVDELVQSHRLSTILHKPFKDIFAVVTKMENI